LAFACNGKGRVARQKAPATAPAAPAAAATSMQTSYFLFFLFQRSCRLLALHGCC